jgi:hypothetical protein
MKLFYMPKTILKQIADCEDNKFYSFDGAPMPYDVIVKAVNAGTIDAEYTVMASPKREHLTEDEKKQMATLRPIDEVVGKLLESQAGGSEEPTVHRAA